MNKKIATSARYRQLNLMNCHWFYTPLMACFVYCTGSAGYQVHKSVAVGSVSEALPYLSRRSQENTSVIINAREERDLLKKEIISRITEGR